MVGDYREHLDEAAVRRLAEAVGERPITQGRSLTAFDLGSALASPQAGAILSDPNAIGDLPRLQLAIAVHQSANNLATSGWTTRDPELIELSLLSFVGQRKNQRIIFDLLTSMLASSDPRLGSDPQIIEPKTVLERFESAIAKINICDPITRPGALRFLADEALFISSLFARAAHNTPADQSVLDMCESVLPSSAALLLPDISKDLISLLDIYLVFGAIWYRAASAGLVFPNEREHLSSLASDFSTARKFLVRVNQDVLTHLDSDMYSHILQETPTV